MEAVALKVIEESSVEKEFYLETVQNPYELFSSDVWLCSKNSGRKVFLTSTGERLSKSLLRELVAEKMPLLSA